MTIGRSDPLLSIGVSLSRNASKWRRLLEPLGARLGNPSMPRQQGAGPPSRSVNWTVGTLRGMLPIPPGVNRTSAHDDGEAAEPDDERFEVRGKREEEGRATQKPVRATDA